MTPPEAPDTQTGNAPPAVSVCPKPLEVLKTRSDFLRTARARREAARRVLPQTGHPGWDYVLIGRVDVTAARPFDQLCNDLAAALVRLHAKK